MENQYRAIMLKLSSDGIPEITIKGHFETSEKAVQGMSENAWDEDYFTLLGTSFMIVDTESNTIVSTGMYNIDLEEGSEPVIRFTNLKGWYEQFFKNIGYQPVIDLSQIELKKT